MGIRYLPGLMHWTLRKAIWYFEMIEGPEMENKLYFVYSAENAEAESPWEKNARIGI